MTQTESRNLKATMTEKFAKYEVEGTGFSFLGFTKKGALFMDKDNNALTISVAIHKEGFDFEDALDEYNDAQEKAKERADKKAKKIARDEEKRENEKNEKELKEKEKEAKVEEAEEVEEVEEK